MINSSNSLSVSEALAYMKKSKKSEDLVKFAKEFVKLDEKQAKDLREKIVSLGLIQMNPNQITKIIDIFPENKEDLNKILVDVRLDEDESNKILDAIKEFE
ncbi:MAG: hypothetical protein WDZ77_00785 [Candidatus Pacearchaeota archaeon]